MVRWSRYGVMLLLILAGAIYIPRLYWRAFWKRPEQRMVRYSATLERFVYRSYSKGPEGTRYLDEDGNEYDEVEFKMHLPFLYFAFLDKYDIFPEEIQGRTFDPRRVRDEIQYVRVQPDELDAPQIDLWPLFESKPVGTQLSMPPDMFRIRDRMEFVDAESNEIDEKKSVEFSAALSDAGFRFPAQVIGGNPNSRKAFDEGYFVADAGGRVFQIKMVEGEPLVVATGLEPADGVRHLLIGENARREFYGAMITGDGRIGLISYDNYRFIELPVEGYDPATMPFYLWVDPLHRTIVFVGEDEVHCVATDPEYKVVATWSFEADESRTAAARKVSDWLFPFRILTGRAESAYQAMDVKWHRFYGVGGVVLGALILLVVRLLRGVPVRRWWGDLVWTAVFGIYGALAALIVGPYPAPRVPGPRPVRTDAA